MQKKFVEKWRGMSFFVEIWKAWESAVTASAEKVSDSINQIMETKAEKAYNSFFDAPAKKIENSNIFFKRKKDFTK